MSGAVILVVEDNVRNLKLIRDVLDFAGFEVVAASSAEEGIAIALERPPDLVLMDLQLPGIDGTETMRRMRSGPLDPQVPVVAVTASALPEDHERAQRAGFDGYLEKPISVRGLVARVGELLQEPLP